MPNRFPWTWPNPFRKDTPERRSGGEYERLLTQALHDAASGSADSAMPGSVATAAGFIARGFAAAEPSGIGAVLYPPSVRSRIAWDLAAYGDSLWQLRNGRLQLVRSYTIRGGTYYHSGVALQDTVHFRVFTGNDGRGYGTLQAGANLYKTAADLERSLRYEARAPTGHILPVGRTDGFEGSR